MRYWYDTEFIEDGHTIDLISIGIVAEDGREYYAQSVEFNERNANDWVRANVFPHLKQCTLSPSYHILAHCPRPECAWRQRSQIALDISMFCDPKKYDTPELWAYYADYDHVAFCQLFGTMMDLPKGYPMYTRDIKQWCDALGNPKLLEQDTDEHNALADARWNKLAWEFLARIEKG